MVHYEVTKLYVIFNMHSKYPNGSIGENFPAVNVIVCHATVLVLLPFMRARPTGLLVFDTENVLQNLSRAYFIFSLNFNFLNRFSFNSKAFGL